MDVPISYHLIDESKFSDISPNNGNYLFERKETILQLLDDVLKLRKNGEAITLADFGTSDGGNVIGLMNLLQGYIQENAAEEREIIIYLEDLDNNDFNGLFTKLRGSPENPGLRMSDNVHVMVIGRNMYDQCLPKNSLDFGFSFNALLNMQKRETNITGGILTTFANCNEEKNLRTQSARDWKRFLLKRGKELKPGGILFIFTLMRASTLQCDGKNICANEFKKLLTDGIITKEEFINTNIDTYLTRTEQDFKEPFTNKDAEIQALQIQLISTRTLLFANFSPLKKDATENEVSVHARKVHSFCKMIYYQPLLCGLSRSRSEEERIGIIETFFERLLLRYVDVGPSLQWINQACEIILRKGV